MEVVLKAEKLTKKFKNKLALDSVSLEVKKGDIYGLIGKNGAGKTTFIKVVTGLIKSTSGDIELFGSKDLNNGRKKIGTVIESPAWYPNFTARQNLEVHKKLLGNIKNNDIDDILKIVGLSDTGRKKAKHFSLGMKQRLGIAIALMGEPEFLVLDEPINGLDPTGIKDMRDLILYLNKERGITILISSHILEELSKVATCYGIISDGVLVDQFETKELNNRLKNYIEIQVGNVEKAINVIKEDIKTNNFDVVDNKIRLYDHFDNMAEINDTLVKNGILVESLSYKNDDSESYFINLMGGVEND